ncbi:MAG: HNH endonuclease [Gloeobacteraceae cyanobacterium ES-bin-144]|nr:HNH endonuclease [Verrucomicrobiales bacterium]
MKWHPFVTGREYPVSQIIEVLRKDIESGRLGFVHEKMQLLELYEPHRSEHAVFTPFGGSWGGTPLNPNTWKKQDGGDLIPGYRQPRKRKPFSKKLRIEVIAKTNGHCYSCGQKFNTPSEVWIEHIIAFSIGGSDTIENLLPGCRICNYTRQNFTPNQIQRILSVGSVLVREMDKATNLGSDILTFLRAEDTRRRSRRRHESYGFLVFEAERTDA